MTAGGWILFILSWGAILGLSVFCFTTMIRSGKM